VKREKIHGAEARAWAPGIVRGIQGERIKIEFEDKSIV